MAADHDRIEKDLEARLLESPIHYDRIDTCIEYQVKRKHGECDVLAVHNKYAIVVEIKGRDKPKNRTKARHQLEKDIRWVHNIYPSVTHIFPLYAYTDSSEKRYNIVLYDNLRMYQ